FSSRRRHTIFSRDWNSDVCSSDLLAIVSAGILGFSEDLTKDSHIDEDVFQKWMELTQEHFPHRKHLAAWNRFRDFLIQLNDDRIDRNSVVKAKRGTRRA